MRIIALTLIALAAYAAPLQAAVIEFHISAGTGGGPWNTKETAVQVVIGDTLRLINDDSVVHALHTDEGIPCEHGSDMAPAGGSYDCVIAAAFDANVDGPLVDHWNGHGPFWLVAQ